MIALSTHLRSPAARRQHGTVLVIALIFLLVMTLLGVSAMQSTLLEERMAGNLRDNSVAFNAAEAGLAAGECRLEKNSTFAAMDFDGSDGTYKAEQNNAPDPLSDPGISDQNAKEMTSLSNTTNPPLYFIERLPYSFNPTGGQVKINYRVVSTHSGASSDANVVLQTTYVPDSAQPNC